MPLSTQADQSIDQFVRSAFRHETHVAQGQGSRLRRVIYASPVLTEMVNQAAAAGSLNWVVAEDNEGLGRMAGTDGKVSARVPRSLLKPPSSRPFDSGPAIFLLGRELHCAKDAAGIRQSWDDFDRALEAVASLPDAEHDYTSAIEDHLGRIRRHEGKAQASGWNAVISATQNERDPERKQSTSFATWTDIYQRSPRHMANFIDIAGDASPRHSLAPALLPYLDRANLFLVDASGLEPIGRRYFKGTDGLAYNDNVHYNQHAAEAIGRAIRFERERNPPHQAGPFHYVSIDMARLKLDPEFIQQHGIYFDGLRYPMPYIDKSAGQPTYREFRLPPGDARQDDELRLDNRSHPHYALYRQANVALREYRRQRWIEILKRELEPEKRQEKWREAEPYLERELERKLERKLGLKLEQKFKEALLRKVERKAEQESGRKPGPRLELKKQFEAMQGLELKQLFEVKKQLWSELDPSQQQRLELELERQMRQASKRSKLEKAVEQREQKLEHRLEQKLGQGKWRSEWQKQEAQLEKNPGLDLDQWRKLWRELWLELWQEHRQALLAELPCPQDQRGKNLAAALAVAARERNLGRIDQVHLVSRPDGLKAYAVQSVAASVPARAEVDCPRALFTTIDESSAQLSEKWRGRQAWTVSPTRREREQAQALPSRQPEQHAPPGRRR